MLKLYHKCNPFFTTVVDKHLKEKFSTLLTGKKLEEAIIFGGVIIPVMKYN